jgi:molybdate transport system substrate-binding protein
VQDVTVYSAGLASTAKEPAAGRALLAYLTSAQATPVLEKMGLQPPAK